MKIYRASALVLVSALFFAAPFTAGAQVNCEVEGCVWSSSLSVCTCTTPACAEKGCYPQDSCSSGACTNEANCDVNERCDNPAGQSCSGDCVPRGSGGSGFNSGGGGGINTQLLERDYVAKFINFVNGALVPALIAIAFIVFLWGVFKYLIWGADDEADRSTGRKFILWSVIGFAAIFSVWGMVNVVTSLFGFKAGQGASNYGIHPPTFPENQ